jgi:hypothetical protein
VKNFTTFLVESEERAKVSIEGFLNKIYNCKTVDGVDELEKHYLKRKEEVVITDSDDITVRDALRGRKDELSVVDGEDTEQEDI